MDYFKPLSGLSLDIMHVLHLGVNPHAFEFLVAPILPQQAKALDKRVAIISEALPASVGRFPTGISKHWSSFKAAQWKNFYLYYIRM